MSQIKAFVLLSGGIDSSTTLGFAVRDHGAENVTAISIDYGQRHRKEMDHAIQVARHFGVPHEVHEIIGIPKVMLTDPKAEVPNISYGEIQGVSPTYVPFRNGQLISRIAGIAAHRINQLNAQAENERILPDPPELWEGRIYIGTHAEDAAGDAYPDCRFDFIGAMAAAVYIGSYHMLRLEAPLISMFKDEIVTAGEKLGVPWDKTWSCYKGERLHCGTCPTCRARKDGFRKAGVLDPTVYQDALDVIDDVPF
jgi:7-cyano-7-deazaguanine synthase